MGGDTLGSASPSLPGIALYPATAMLVLVLAMIIAKTRNTAARFVIFACAFRYLVSTFHQVTFQTSPLGVSWNALGSIFVCLLGIAVLKQGRILKLFYLPIYLMMLIVIVSGAYNGLYSGVMNNVAKLGYLTVVCAGTAEAMRDYGEDRFLKALLWSFAAPLFFQFLSIVLNVPKAGELDGSDSYIGGYNHEGGFSIVLATCFLVAVLSRKLSKPVKGFLLLDSLVGILLANYRTTILAIAPLVFTQATAGIAQLFKKGQREAVFIFFLALSAVAFAVVVWAAQDRFMDLGTVWEKGLHIIQRPEQFSPDERRLMSGRPYIWSQYIYGYIDGNAIQHWIGLGPDSWVDKMPLYAHNTLVSYLYEYGIVGVAGILFLWGWMLSVALRVRGPSRTKLLAAHASFIILNLATMPFWQIEGNIFYGILCGATLANAWRRPMPISSQMPAGGFRSTQPPLRPGPV
ncbi:MAG TPA: hypothetical protein VJ859_01275 [Allosphingosinicella sp.]|nr:hypothetical protein [Allosphingosinicella sp.]